jgi:hypothetical protein
MMMTRETDVLKDENAELLAELLTLVHQAARKGTAIHEVELGLWKQLLTLGFNLLSQFVALQGTGDVGETVQGPDGQTWQRLPQKHRRGYTSIFGKLPIERTVYGSREGQKIEFVPLDNRLQLPESNFSYVLQDWDQGLCVEEAFGQASRTLEKILGLKQSVDSLEHMNVQMAKEVPAFREERPQLAPEEEGEIVVGSADGKGVVMRREPSDAAPKAHRTKGDKASKKEMAIVGAVYTIDRFVRTPEQIVAALFRDDRDEPQVVRPKPCGKQTIANLTHTTAAGTVTGLEETYTWMFEEIWRRNRGYGKAMVHLCDGQESLWDARQKHLVPHNTTDILDLLHVTPRLWQAAHLFHKEKSDGAEQFIRERLLKVLQGKSDLVVRGLREMGTKRRLKGAKKKALAKICNYLENNRERMHYDEYLAKGYPIASGVIEGACRHLVKDRMERAGMHWRRQGAQAMLDVRSIHTNGDWETYQSYRIELESKRLYPYRDLVAGETYYSLAA